MSYWQERSHYNYYQVVKQRLGYVKGKSLLDIGSADTPVVTWGTFRHRCTVDPHTRLPALPGVTRITGKWPLVDLTGIPRPDVVTCLQVIEHIPDAQVMLFTERLLRFKHLLISVPYMWPAGADPGHLQDPINLRKLIRLMHNTEPVWMRLVRDGSVMRLVAEFLPC
jgi:hypothetical protein